jgi:hypothetical protein
MQSASAATTQDSLRSRHFGKSDPALLSVSPAARRPVSGRSLKAIRFAEQGCTVLD